MSDALSRRWFLKGAAGATLAIPVLPSLLTARAAKAQAAQPRQCFIAAATRHGGIWPSNMFPADATLTQSQSYAGFGIQRGALVSQVNGAERVVSNVLRAPDAVFSAAVAAKMNVLRGLSIPFYLGHHSGGHLGNYARNDGSGEPTGDGRAVAAFPRPTIDQLMAYSPAFYANLNGVRQRSVLMGRQLSYNFANPATRSGGIQEVGATANHALELFNTLFPMPGGGPAPRAPIVDRVLENYRRLRDGNRRLSANDRRRLDEHLQRVDELQRQLTSTTAPQCTTVTRPANLRTEWLTGIGYSPMATQLAGFQGVNDVLVLALSCGVTRIAAIDAGAHFQTYNPDDWHQQVAHQGNQAAAQAQLVEGNRQFFAGVLAPLASRLNSIDMGDGTRLLDRCLLAWSQESGNSTHDPQGIPVVTFGSADGFLTTGNYCDYRNRAAVYNPVDPHPVTAGVLWNQWLGTALQAMRVPKAEYEVPATCGGYPDVRYANIQWSPLQMATAYPAALWNLASDVLPWLRA